MERKWLIQLRKSIGMTQQQLANAAFIDRGYYSQIETGKRNPRFQVAISISKVLDFDPMLFLLNDSTGVNTYNIEVTKQLRKLNTGEIVYLFNNSNIYQDNLNTFLLTKIERKTSCIIIDTYENNKVVHQRLERFLSITKRKRYIHLLHKEELQGMGHEKKYQVLNSLIDRVGEVTSLAIWLLEGDTGGTSQLTHFNQLLKDMVRGKFPKDMDILYIHVFDANKITAGEHIEMLRTWAYFMTDYELVKSPLHYTNSQTQIYPSLRLEHEE